MEIKYKLYPYPVLSTYSDDYKTGEFSALIEPRKEGYDLKVDFTATLTNEALRALIRSEQAKYVYHMECAQTGFRKVFQTGKSIASDFLPDKQLSGKLQICPFVVAVKDIFMRTITVFPLISRLVASWQRGKWRRFMSQKTGTSWNRCRPFSALCAIQMSHADIWLWIIPAGRF